MNNAVGGVEKTNNELKLDYLLENPKDRIKLVKKIINTAEPEKLTPKYLEILSDYIVFAMDKEEKKQKNILTENHLVTVNNRETSYQGLVSKLENGEDGLYNMMTGGDKNILFLPKTGITEKDLKEIPPLRELKESIEIIKEMIETASGRKKFLLKKQLKEMYQEQYTIKAEYKKPMYSTSLTKSFNQIDLSENYYIDEDGQIASDAILTLLNPDHVSALLCNYCKLKEEAWGNFWGDAYYLMEDLDNLIEQALKKDYPLYYDIVIYKIDGLLNSTIQELLIEKHHVKHSIEYISSLWRNKIPKLIAKKAQENALEWYYTEKERGQWKKCTKCGQIKLAHSMFYSKNKGSRDGWYSICKECRNTKKKKG